MADESPAVECFSECPYFRSVSGACDHDLSQALVGHFVDYPNSICPVYDEWRADRMAALARRLEER